jgi:hypothetical protein
MSTPPTAATTEASAKAVSFAEVTLIPSDAAARSFDRWCGNGVEGEAEDARGRDGGTREAAGVTRVVHDDALDRNGKAEGSDRQVDSPRAQCRQRDGEPGGNGGDNCPEQTHPERHPPDGDHAGGDEPADPGERELRERELTGVPRDDNHREPYRADSGGDRGSSSPVCREQRHEDDAEQREERDAGESRPGVADSRWPVEDVAARWD